MIRAIAAFAVAACLLFATEAASANPNLGTIHPNVGTDFSAKKHKRVRHHVVRQRVQDATGVIAQCDDRYCTTRASGHLEAQPNTRRGRVHYAYDTATVVGRRPQGCPWAFCGCEASLYKFGRIIPSLNLAWNWVRKFPRTSPAPGMAAARKGHVMILMSHVGGNEWLVHDGNSGGKLTREHVRSINGYVIVNPNVRMASSE